MDDFVEKIKTAGAFTRDDFFKLYRILCKNTHPDLTGKDGRDFIRLQEIYDKIKETLQSQTEVTGCGFNPYRVITELGYKKPVHPRDGLFIALHRYVSLGLHTHKVRSKSVLKERNNLIIRTVLYWARRYDKQFVDIFSAYNMTQFDPIQIGNSLERSLKGKRYFFNKLR